MRRWVGLAIAAAVLLGAGLFFALRREESPGLGPGPEELRGTRTVELVFPGPDGEVVRETREILGGELLEEDVRALVEELIAGSSQGVHPLPVTTRLLNVFFDGEEEIALNFTEHLRADHPGGSEAEIATLTSLVATVGANVPGVDRVRVLIDGEVVPTLAGHVDLREPLEVRDLH